MQYTKEQLIGRQFRFNYQTEKTGRHDFHYTFGSASYSLSEANALIASGTWLLNDEPLTTAAQAREKYDQVVLKNHLEPILETINNSCAMGIQPYVSYQLDASNGVINTCINRLRELGYGVKSFPTESYYTVILEITW